MKCADFTQGADGAWSKGATTAETPGTAPSESAVAALKSMWDSLNDALDGKLPDSSHSASGGDVDKGEDDRWDDEVGYEDFQPPKKPCDESPDRPKPSDGMGRHARQPTKRGPFITGTKAPATKRGPFVTKAPGTKDPVTEARGPILATNTANPLNSKPAATKATAVRARVQGHFDFSTGKLSKLGLSGQVLMVDADEPDCSALMDVLSKLDANGDEDQVQPTIVLRKGGMTRDVKSDSSATSAAAGGQFTPTAAATAVVFQNPNQDSNEAESDLKSILEALSKADHLGLNGPADLIAASLPETINCRCDPPCNLETNFCSVSGTKNGDPWCSCFGDDDEIYGPDSVQTMGGGPEADPAAPPDDLDASSSAAITAVASIVCCAAFFVQV